MKNLKDEIEEEFYIMFQEEYPHLSDEQAEGIKQFINSKKDKFYKEVNPKLMQVLGRLLVIRKQSTEAAESLNLIQEVCEILDKYLSE